MEDEGTPFAKNTIGRPSELSEKPLRIDRNSIRRDPHRYGFAPEGQVAPSSLGPIGQSQTPGEDESSQTTDDSNLSLLDFRTLLNAAPDGIAVVDDQGRIVVVNEQLCELSGYKADELLGRNVEALIPPRFRGHHRDHMQQYRTKPTRRPMGLGLDLVGQRTDGSEFPVEISLSPVISCHQTFTIATVRDVSERRRLQAEQDAMRTTLDTEQERYRIGMDLHDGIMQDIYAVTLSLDMAFDDVKTNPARAKDGIGRSIDLLHSTIRDIRSYIFDLRPRQFTGDICQALVELGREFQDNSSIPTDVRVSPELPDIDPDLGVALYVIAHEALSNTRKYAHASSVKISLAADDRSIQLEVRDDGCGFDPSVEVSEGHHGLRNMTSRTGVIGAELRVESTPGVGTAVKVNARLDQAGLVAGPPRKSNTPGTSAQDAPDIAGDRI